MVDPSVDAAQPADPLDLFPPEPTTISPAPAPPPDALVEFPAEPPADDIRTPRQDRSAANDPSHARSPSDRRAILGVLLAIGLILASIHLSLHDVMAVSLATSAPASQQRSTTFGEPHQPAAVAPYAHAAWVKLGALVPTDAETADVYVRLIAIEGKVLLPRDE